jgi:alpha-tubulin suppressor-like RCC1 family protein
VLVSGGGAFRAVVAGGGHTCGITQGTGQLSCWGYNHSGPLGTGGFANASAPTPVVGPQTARTFDVGLHHTCAVGPAGEALCWGFNRFGQLGDRSTVRAAAPGFVVDEETRPVAPASRSTAPFEALQRLLDHRN